MPCGAGTYYDVEEDRCGPCAVGLYQDEEAQFHCKQCPRGTASVEPGAMNLTQCLGNSIHCIFFQIDAITRKSR